MTSETPWNGASLNFGYNARSDMTSITNYPSNILLGSDASESIAYDPADNPTSETVTGLTGLPAPLVGPQFSDTFTSNPDELYLTQSTTIPTTIPATVINNSYTYSAKHQDQLAGTDTYVNSPGGEVKSDTPAGKLAITNTYNGASELTQSVNPNTSITTSFGYDTDGNRCASVASATAPSCAAPPAGATTYGWNAYNQMCWSGSGTTAAGDGTCYSPPIGATTYTYDGTGLRVSDTAGGSSQNFVYDTATRSGQPLVMMDGTNAYIYGPANFGSGTAPLEQIPLNLSILPSYLFSDPNGVRSMMTTVTVPVLGTIGIANGSWTYGTYGTRTATGLNLLASTPFAFQGGYTDPTGFIYFVNRYYDPATQQWTSVDPDVAATGQPYAFGGNNPTNVMDPLGLYNYNYYWDLGPVKKVGTAEQAFKYFISHAGRLFPFSTGNCAKLAAGEKCDFRPFGTHDILHVSKITKTSLTLTVNNWCSAGVAGICAVGDPPKSTISFTVGYAIDGNREDVYLEQHGNSPKAGPLTNALAMHMAIFQWQQQANNLSSALGGGGNVAIIVGPGWSTGTP
jgi:RHS repeat-associated protein